MLSDNKEIQIRLNAEHGEFMYLVAIDQIPEMNAEFDVDDTDTWIGGEIAHVTIKEEDLDEVLFRQVENSLPSRNSSAYSDKLINFYMRVYPLLNAYEQIDTLPYIFSIAYYDEEQMNHLVDSTPQRGVVTN